MPVPTSETQRPELRLAVPSSDLPRVVVVGGGFAGLKLVHQLDPNAFQVVLIDRKNFHTFQPLLYQVATAGLEPASIAAPFRRIFKRRKNFHFRMVELEGLRASEHELLTTGGVLKYDKLILCHGATTNFFGNAAAERVSRTLKTVPDALDIRSIILENFEEALLLDVPAEADGLIDVVIVGGGASGVELAGAFAELKRQVLPRDYPDFPVDRMQVHLVEASPRLLNGFSDQSAAKALQFLSALGVRTHLGAAVSTVAEKSVTLEGGQTLRAGLLIWAAGVRANAVPGLPEACFVGGQRRIQVDSYMQVTGLEDVFAVGDIACVVAPDTPRGHPQVAQVAIQQAACLAANLGRVRAGRAPQAFEYHSRGSMATVGRNRAIVEVGKMRLAGSLAWFLWMGVHLLALVGFRNRVSTLLDWVANYLTYDRSFRLVFRNVNRRFGGSR